MTATPGVARRSAAPEAAITTALARPTAVERCGQRIATRMLAIGPRNGTAHSRTNAG